MNFKYRIVNNEVIITGLIDDFVKEINIPELIDGLPVTGIGEQSFYCVLYVESLMIPNSVVDIHWNIFSFNHEIKYINNNKVTGESHVINNRHIYCGGDIYDIIYQIGSDYYCGAGINKRYFIDGLVYWNYKKDSL